MNEERNDSPGLQEEPATTFTAFRAEALDFQFNSPPNLDLVQVSPGWTWAVLYGIGILLLSGGLFSVLGRIEVVERGPGILRPCSGVRALVAQASGTVVEVLVQPGREVHRGDPILRIHVPQTQGAILEADQTLADQGQGFLPVARGQAELFDVQVTNAQAAIRHKEEALASYQRARIWAQERLAASEHLFHLGIVAKAKHQGTLDQLEEAQRQVAEGEQALFRAKADLVALRARRREQTWDRSREAALARVRREALELARAQSLVLAPDDGVLDGLAVRPGDAIQAGMAVAKVVPRAAPLGIVALVPEKDRGFVREGDQVALELNQYPYFEFGALRGRVSRLGAYLATPTEIQEILGEASPSAGQALFRVDIDLELRQSGRIAGMNLRPGMLLKARFTLRRRSPISFLLDPLRKWKNPGAPG